MPGKNASLYFIPSIRGIGPGTTQKGNCPKGEGFAPSDLTVGILALRPFGVGCAFNPLLRIGR